MYKYIFLIFSILLCTSCNTSKKVRYVQDIELSKLKAIQPECNITLQPQDAVTIVISSKDPALAALFNLPRISYRAGSTQLSSYDSQISQYTLDSDGYVDFPVLGKIKISNYRKEEVAELIKNRLIKENLIKDPVVTVEFINLYYSIIGEIAKPGKYKIDRDKINILEAIGTAGDLTIFGKRDCVYIIRESDKNRITYKVDLRSQDIFKSPAFYIKQNDIIYVEPNNYRANQSTVNGNNSKNITTWISIISVLTTLSVLIFK